MSSSRIAASCTLQLRLLPMSTQPPKMVPNKDLDISLGASTPKIAIKGFSLSTKLKPSTNNSANSNTNAKPKHALASTLGKRPRSALQHHDDSDSEGEDNARGKHEAVTGFGAEGAIRTEEKEKKAPLVIEALAGRDWRAEIKRLREQAVGKGRNLLPPEVQAQRAAVNGDVNGRDRVVVEKGNVGEGEPAWGLTVTRRDRTQDVVSRDGENCENHKLVETEGESQSKMEDPPPPTEKTDDQLALEALMGVKAEKKGPALVISGIENTNTSEPPITEKDAYRRAVASAPEVSTLEDYERVPVEEFGAALLRGMGWKEGSKVERPKEIKRRQNLLGLGASQLKDAEELGAWVQKSDVKRLKAGGSGGGKGSGGYGDGGRPPKISEYRREKERREERREERGGGSYRRERERERERGDYRDRDRDRDRDRRR